MKQLLMEIAWFPVLEEKGLLSKEAQTSVYDMYQQLHYAFKEVELEDMIIRELEVPWYTARWE